MKNSRKLLRYILSLWMLLCTSAISFGQEKKDVIPNKFVALVYMSGNKDFVYYALSEKKKTEIEVNGPGTLTIYNRARLENNEKASKPYYLRYLMDGKLIQSKKIGPQSISRKYKYKSNLTGSPSKAQKEEIRIPPGKHTLSFFKYKASHKAHVRFEFKESQPLSWAELPPDRPLQQVAIKYVPTGKRTEYYRVGSTNTYRFSVDGGAKLRVFLRADFTYNMHAQRTVRLDLIRNGSVLRTYKMTCHKSRKSEYVSEKKMMLGTLEKIYVDIPAGLGGQYELRLRAANGSALIRASLGVSDQKKNL
ncbi:MAG: hypothetical protein AAF466_10775 [Bacteroidota bacterium]